MIKFIFLNLLNAFQFVGVQGLLTVVYDKFPQHLYKTKNKMIVGAVYCSLSFLIGLSMVTEVGLFCFTFLHDHAKPTFHSSCAHSTSFVETA